MHFITGFLALVAVLFFPLLSAAADPFEALSVIRIQPKTAPTFSLPQVDGKTVSLSDFTGKAVLLGFFKTF
jgi:cytochrome oxidase Cu insertion factor (SCO1/SenC/PrrC family)